MPVFTPRQRHKLDEIRREHSLESAQLTPEDRMRRSDELRRMADSVRPGGRTSSDESVEVMRRWKRHFAKAVGT